MLNIVRDASGDQKVVWATRDQDIIEAAQAYVEYERTLEDDKRLRQPSCEEIEAAVAAAQDALDQQMAGESARASASASLSSTADKAVETGKLAIGRLKGKYFDNLAQLEQWGLDTKISKRGSISVRQPTSLKGWSNLYQTYVAKEESLDEDERMTEPSLEEMKSLSSDLALYLKQRKSGQDKREAAVASRSTAAQFLQGLLQAAALNRVLFFYDGKVSAELQNWGYHVLAQKSRSTGGSSKDSLELEESSE